MLHRWVLLCVALSPLVALADEPVKKEFNPGPDTEKAPIPFLTPEQSLKALKLPEGFTATMFAHEPDVRNPIGIATDERGRLWVAENYTYSESSLGWNDSLKDRVIVLEDTDGDGKADKRKVFWENGRRLTSVEIGYGGVWVLDAPRLLFIPDKNRDDIPDGEPVVMLDGWNDGAIRHNIVNGLRWGPDGWLYGRHGILATSYVGRPGASPDQRTPMNVGIWRFHPTRHVFEVVCNGTTNPWGMDWDENGELFFINTVIGHLWHAIPGAYFRRMYGEHLNPNVYQSIEQTADHFHWDTAEQWHDIRKIGVSPTTDKAGGGHAHSGMAIIKSKRWPKEYQGSVLTVNLHGHRINRDTIVREGATFVGKHAPDFASTSDAYFRGVELLEGMNGELFIADWSDVGECHENDGVHRSSGRILMIQPKTPADTRWKPTPDAYNESELDTLASNDNYWRTMIRQREILSLADATKQAKTPVDAEALEKMVEQKERLKLAIYRFLLERRPNEPELSRQYERQALWSLRTLAAMGEVNVYHATEWIAADSEPIRITCLRICRDLDPRMVGQQLSFQVYAPFRGRPPQSGLEATYVASVIQRLWYQQRGDSIPFWELSRRLAQHAELANDRVFPLMLWYGIEAAVPAQPDEAVKIAAESKIPLLREFIARRLSSNIERAPEPVAKLVAVIDPSGDKDGIVVSPHPPLDDAGRLAILKGMATGLKGWRKAPAPSNWKAVSEQLAKSKNADVQTLTRELSVVFGDGRALAELRKIAEDNNALTDERRAAVRALVVARAPNLVPLLQNLTGNRELVVDAVRGLAAFDNSETAGLLVARYKGLSFPGKQEAISTLVSRPNFARVLLTAVKEEKIPRGDVSAFQLRQLQNLGDESLKADVAKQWPELEQQSKEKTAFIAALRGKMTPETLGKGNASQGRLLFSKSCANCHTLFGEGKKIAPDLTGGQRGNLNYLLENIIDPSATVSENFRMTVFVLEDGRVLNGVIVERAEKTLTVQTATDRVTLQKDEIEEQRDSKLSMMPENLLAPLTDEQIRDLFSYLQSPSQVPLP